MSDTSNPQEKLYYFSVFFGEATRILNWHWDRDLALIWLVTQQVQQQASLRFQSIPREPVVSLSGGFFEVLTQTSVELADYIERKGTEEELCILMGRLAELAYVTTGNGYYLLQKGDIKLT
jgi:hypothetical protein